MAHWVSAFSDPSARRKIPGHVGKSNEQRPTLSHRGVGVSHVKAVLMSCFNKSLEH
jgi:hypothetical protein